MKLQRHWIIALVVIALLWAGVAFVYHATEDNISTPEKVLGFMAATPWLTDAKAMLSTVARAQHIDLVVRNVNMLNFEERTRVREDGGSLPKRFFDSLTQEERKDYVDRTLQRHFDAVIKGFAAMSAEERKGMASRVRRDIRANRGKDEDEQREIGEDEKEFDEFIDIGIEAYLKSATTEEKMRLAPMIEDMHTRMQGFRR